MKVLLITSLYYPHVGGIETMTRELSKLYRDNDIDVCMLTKKWPDNLCEHEKVDGMNVYRVKSAFTKKDYLQIINWVKKNEIKIKADIIHVVGARRPMPFIGLLLGKKWGVPVIVTVAGGEVPHGKDSETRKIWESGIKIIPETLLQVDCVTAVSKYMKAQMLAIVPNLKKVSTIYAGINVCVFSSKNKNRPIDILSLRRLEYSKGVDDLIRAVSKLVNVFPRLRVVITGDGEQKKELIQLTRDLKLNKYIKFIGTVSIEVAAKLLKKSVITVVASRTEGGGLVNVEAQAAGCAVVASNADGILEYVGGRKSAIIVKKNSPDEIAEGILKLLTDKRLREKIIARGYKNANKFDWAVLAPMYICLYNKLIDNHKSKAFTPWSPFVASVWNKLNE